MLEIMSFCASLDFNGDRPRTMLSEALAARVDSKPEGMTFLEWIDSILWRFNDE